MELKFNLTEKEARFLQMFAEKQYEGAKDNLGTATPIHVVEREESTFVTSDDGDTFEWCGNNGLSPAKYYDSLNDITDLHNAETDDNAPYYDDGEVSKYYGANEYFEYYGINACAKTIVKSYSPVAFFFILDEARRYKDDYQKHNCANCRIHTYGLGYSNYGDMPVFRELLMKMGTMLIEQNDAVSSISDTAAPAVDADYAKTLLSFRDKYNSNGAVLNVDSSLFIPDRLDCLWYNGEIASVTYGNIEVSVRVTGEVNATYFADNDEQIDVRGTGVDFLAEFKEVLPTDTAVATAIDHGRLVLENNNWVEYFFYRNGEYLAGQEKVACTSNVLQALDPVYIFHCIRNL